jgi:hypothetical protein
MRQAYAARGIESSARVARIDEEGARVELLNDRSMATEARSHDARR